MPTICPNHPPTSVGCSLFVWTRAGTSLRASCRRNDAAAKLRTRIPQESPTTCLAASPSTHRRFNQVRSSVQTAGFERAVHVAFSTPAATHYASFTLHSAEHQRTSRSIEVDVESAVSNIHRGTRRSSVPLQRWNVSLRTSSRANLHDEPFLAGTQHKGGENTSQQYFEHCGDLTCLLPQ